MAIQKLEDMIVWQKAQDMAVLVYQLFRSNNDFGFRDQIQRAAVSVSNNLAEGLERSSDADFTRFLYIALGSCSEVKSMVYLSVRLKYIDSNQQEKLLELTNEIGKMIRGLIQSLQKKSTTTY